MKKLVTAVLIVGLSLIFSTGVVVAQSADETVYPRLKTPTIIKLHSNFSETYTLTLAHYKQGFLEDLKVGKIEMGGSNDLRIEARLTNIDGAGSDSRAAEAFQIAEKGKTWQDFSSVGDTKELNYISSVTWYMTDWIQYKWVISELEDVNMNKNIRYDVMFIVTSA